LDGRATTVEVKEGAEEEFVEYVDDELQGTVFSAGCSNWYMNKEGRNSASWPGRAATYWYKTIFPRWNDFVLKGGSSFWTFKGVYQAVFGGSFSYLAILCSLVGLGLLAKDRNLSVHAQKLLARIKV
jgi:hypothetical protein